MNVQGTLNFLEDLPCPGLKVDRFVFTSTTSPTNAHSTGRQSCRRQGGDVDPRDARAARAAGSIYGVSKRVAEAPCRLFNHLHKLPTVILRTARFFPEEDDMAHAIEQSGDNTKANEFLFRRLSWPRRPPKRMSPHSPRRARSASTPSSTPAMTQFSRQDCRDLIVDAPSVVARYFPDYRALYDKRGWTMFASIDRVYDASKAARKLGFVCRTGFSEILDGLRMG